MRTIKDPKKTPDVRRRIDIEEEEAASTKSTPPKKRRTAKTKTDDSLNDSGSTLDTSDIPSDRSFLGSDSFSDTSSLKSTPPKKRGYNKVVRNLELNGEIDDHDDAEKSNKKARPKRANKQKESNLSGENDDLDLKHEKVHKFEAVISPAESPKLLKRAAQKVANEKILGKKKDVEEKETTPKEKNKKVSPKKQNKDKKEEEDKLDKVKKPQARKRKLDVEKAVKNVKEEPAVVKKGPVKRSKKEEVDEAADVSSPPKPKKQKKTKKQLEKEQAEELKRQTEEQRNNHDKSKASDLFTASPDLENTKEKVDVSKKLDSSFKEQSEIESKEIPDAANDRLLMCNIEKDINEQLPKLTTDISEKQENGHAINEDDESKFPTTSDLEGVVQEENDCALNNKDDINLRKDELDIKEDDEDSELDTSFESISSGYRPPDEPDLEPVEFKENNNVSALLHAEDESKEINGDTKIEIKCDFCGSISKSKGGHTRHLRKCQPHQFEALMENAHKMPKVFKCENCDYSAPRRVLVVTHMKSHGIYQCKRCRFRTDSEDNLEEHTITEHKDRSDCKFCKLCNRYVKCNEIPLEKHMEECQGRVPFKCPECDKEFQYESSLKCHVVSHYPDKPKLFSCDQCDYKSNYKANLKKHIRHIHEQKKTREIKCLECEKMFYTDENMRRHLKLHSGEKPFKCEEKDCDKAFKTPNGLKFHMIAHSGEKPFTCSVCSKEFKTERCLTIHNREVHDGAPKSFKCSYDGCEFAFYKKSGLDRHLAYHADNRSYFCTYSGCPKAFRSPDTLKVHSLQHTNENPVSCEHCPFVCKQKNSLRFHMLKKHPEIIQETIKVKQKLVAQKLMASQTPSVTSEPGEMSIFHQNNLHSVMDAVPTSENNTEKSPQSPDPSNVPSNSHHTKEKSEPFEEAECDQAPSETPDTIKALETIEKTESPQPKEPVTMVTEAERKPSEADLYEFQSEDEDGHKMQPGLLRKEFDKDKPPLPPVSSNLIMEKDLSSKEEKPRDKPGNTTETPKVRKKPGPKPKPKPEKTEEEAKPKKRGRKKKSETEKEKVEEGETKTNEENKGSDEKKVKVKKRSGSPKGKKEKPVKDTVKDTESESESPSKVENKPEKKKRGRKPKEKVAENPEEPVKKKRGRKKKVKEEEEVKVETPDIDGGEQDATINYSEVEGGELLTDSKDGVSDLNPDSVDATKNLSGPLINLKDSLKAHIEPAVTAEMEDNDMFNSLEESKTVDESKTKDENVDENIDEIVDKNDDEKVDEKDDENIDETVDQNIDENVKEKIKEINDNDENNVNDESNVKDENNELDENKDSKNEEAKEESDVESDRFSSDLGSDFEEDIKPPPAPRPPPMYDSEDGDIESGPENEDFNNSMLSNEPLRDFESSREISREISRDFESSRDESVKIPSEVNSVETSTPKDDGQPLSVKMDSVRSVEEHGTPLGQDIGTPHHSHHGSLPHTPSHSSIPPTPTGNPEFESHGIEDRVDDRLIKGQNNDENTDESSMPEVDKDYVGRFFEEIQSVPSQGVVDVDPITRMDSMEENGKAKDIQDIRSDSGVPSSLTSTESNLQMQSPPADLSLKRMEILSADRHNEEHYQPRAESVSRPADRIPSVYDSQYTNPLDSYPTPLSRDSVLRQTDSVKVPSPNPASFMRFPESEAMLQRQKMSNPYDRNIQNLQRITDSALPAPAHTSSSPLLRHDMFSGGSGVPGSMARNPFQSSWPGQEVRPAHWAHPTYLQRPLDQHTASPSSSLFGKDSYLTSREFMFDPTRVAAERNMFSSLASSQRPDIPHDTFQFDRFDLGSYLSSHGYNASPSLPVDYTRATHSSTQKSLDERYRQSSSGVSEFRGLPPTSTSDVFGVNSSFNLEKYGYPRDPLYHSQHLSDNPNNPLFPHGVPSQHSMFGRDYPHRSFYTQNTPYGFMNEKNYAAASAKLGHSSTGVPQQRELVPVPRPNMSAPESQLQDPYRYHSSMLHNMMNRYFE